MRTPIVPMFAFDAADSLADEVIE
jgi:transposase-like protein DUF772